MELKIHLVMNSLIESYEHTRSLVLKVIKEMRQLAKTDRYKKQIALIRSVPGIGEIGRSGGKGSCHDHAKLGCNL